MAWILTPLSKVLYCSFAFPQQYFNRVYLAGGDLPPAVSVASQPESRASDVSTDTQASQASAPPPPPPPAPMMPVADDNDSLSSASSFDDDD